METDHQLRGLTTAHKRLKRGHEELVRQHLALQGDHGNLRREHDALLTAHVHLTEHVAEISRLLGRHDLGLVVGG